MHVPYPALYERLRGMRDEFRSAEPFPHVVIDGFLDAAAYEQIQQAFPDPADDIWKEPSNPHTGGKMVTKRGDADLKELLYSDAARGMLREFNSSLFLRAMEELTGIAGLIGDPYFAEAGFHCSRRGGHLDVHADFSHHDALGLERRLNFLLYLNDGWDPAWGGALNLYDQGLAVCRTVSPVGNTCVVFETSDHSFHGHPEPMTPPEGVFRRSIALYYYSLPTGRARSKILFPTDPEFVPEVTEV